jgi:hypothetical protein
MGRDECLLGGNKMKLTNKMAALLLLLLALAMPFAAGAQIDGRSDHGAFAVELEDKLYAALYSGSGYGLYSIPATGGELTLRDSAPELDELLTANGLLYYLRTKDGAAQIMRVDPDGSPTVLAEFENGVQVGQLSWYDDVLYCIADNRLYIVDPDAGNTELLCEELVDEYAIVNDVVFYVSATDERSYERSAPAQEAGAEGQALSQAAGTLWSMSILGTNPEKLVDEGVTSLRAEGNYLFFHNLSDSYIMGSGADMWLEGKLYRYNIETQQLSSLNLDYDWDYYPTASGLVVYTSQDISLYPLTGGEGDSLMQPESRTVLTASGDTAYVYEYTLGKLTKLPLDGSDALVLSDESDILPSDSDPDDDTGVVMGDQDDEDDAATGDATYDDEDGSVKAGSPSSYIFPNSSTKKLTRAQVLAVDKSLWGYARNEIYARHGYTFKNSKYKEYFSGKSWYTPGGFSTGSLNSIEWYNMELIKDLEQEHGLLGTSVSSKSSSKNKNAKNNYYILKEASSKKLTKKYIKNKLGSKSKYALARNEILARHGYVFKTPKYKKYFNNQKWYKPGGYSSKKLSSIEWYNIALLKELEK